jgi:hypothetical protein
MAAMWLEMPREPRVREALGEKINRRPSWNISPGGFWENFRAQCNHLIQ